MSEILWGKGINYTSEYIRKYYETHEPCHKTITFQQAQQVWEGALSISERSPCHWRCGTSGYTYSCDAQLVALHTDGITKNFLYYTYSQTQLYFTY